MPRRTPPLNWLRAFEAAARFMSFTRAADELGVTQSAVSRQVANLEKYLGKSLLKRTTRNLVLTDAGKKLAPALSLALDSIARTLELLTEEQPDLRLVASPTFALRLLLPKLREFEEMGLARHVRVTTTLRTETFESWNFDVGILYGNGYWPDLNAECIFPELLVPLCSPTLAEGKVPLCAIEDLRRFNILHSSGDHRDWRLWAEANEIHDLDTDQGISFETLDLAFRAATTGHGVLVGDLYLIADDLASRQLMVPFKKPVSSGSGYYFVCQREQMHRSMIKGFRDWIFSSVRPQALPDYLGPWRELLQAATTATGDLESREHLLGKETSVPPVRP